MTLNLRHPIFILALSLAWASLTLIGCGSGQRSSDEPAAPEVRVIVPVDGALQVNDQTVAMIALRDHLKAGVASGEIWPQSQVIIVGEPATTWERLREAYGQVLASGLRHARITQRSDAPAPSPEQP